MSGKTSTLAKNRYNAKTYEQIPLRVRIGQRNAIRAHAESKGMSLNGYINKLIAEDMGEALNG